MLHPTLTRADFADFNAYLIDATRARVELARAERRAYALSELARCWAELDGLVELAERGLADAQHKIAGRALVARIRELSAELGVAC